MNTDAADTHFSAWMRENLDLAAAHFSVAAIGEPTFGWRLRSIGSRVEGAGGTRWLRVVSQEPEWARGDTWTGCADANLVTGVPKPRVLDVFEWSEGRRQRAELMTVSPGVPCSPTDVLRSPPTLSAQWWETLRQSLDAIAPIATQRIYADQEQVSQRVRERFGAGTDTTVDKWETVHGDLHWSNLLCPEFALLDWELWGRGPAGTDAATLYCYSLLMPDTAEQVASVLGDLLDHRAHRVAQLFVIARLLRRIDDGDHPDLVAPLTRHAEHVLKG